MPLGMYTTGTRKSGLHPPAYRVPDRNLNFERSDPQMSRHLLAVSVRSGGVTVPDRNSHVSERHKLRAATRLHALSFGSVPKLASAKLRDASYLSALLVVRIAV